MTKNVYFHDNVLFILKTSPGLTVSVLVYYISLRSLVFLSSVERESCPRSDTLIATATCSGATPSVFPLDLVFFHFI